MKFTLGEVLSITDGRLMCDMGGVYRILNHMTGDNLFTHQLPRAARECKPFLLKQFPQLANVKMDNFGPENAQKILDALQAEYGNEFDVQPLPKHAHEFIDPLSELAEKVHPDKIIVAKT